MIQAHSQYVWTHDLTEFRISGNSAFAVCSGGYYPYGCFLCFLTRGRRRILGFKREENLNLCFFVVFKGRCHMYHVFSVTGTTLATRRPFSLPSRRRRHQCPFFVNRALARRRNQPGQILNRKCPPKAERSASNSPA